MHRVGLLLLAACGTAPPPTPPTTPAPTPPSAPADASVPVVIAPPPGCADKEACHHEAEEREADGDFVAAATAYGRACGFGDGASCFAQGLMLRGRIQPPDDSRSHDAFVKACDLAIADGCAQAGTDLVTGIGVSEDVAKGRAMMDRACTAGSGLSCYNIAVSAREGTFGATKDAKAAYTLFDKGCTAGFAAACTEQAIALYDGAGVKKDRAVATAIAGRACEAKAVQCYFLAELQQKAKKLPEARALYDKACGAGSAVACHNLGVMFEKGLGGRKDEHLSFEAFQKACSLGMSDDCWQRREKECGTGFEDACKQRGR